ncbi:hypothetical protein NQZ68_000985 [Dissostichus eleginoides]|nr:hypothetical protein NQZ68_000985 [Dissostichus eleginoides]
MVAPEIIHCTALIQHTVTRQAFTSQCYQKYTEGYDDENKGDDKKRKQQGKEKRGSSEAMGKEEWEGMIECGDLLSRIGLLFDKPSSLQTLRQTFSSSSSR